MNWNLVVLIVAILVSLGISAILFMLAGTFDKGPSPKLYAGGEITGSTLNVRYSVQNIDGAPNDVTVTLTVNGQTATQTIPKGVEIAGVFDMQIPAGADNLPFTLSLTGGLTMSITNTANNFGH